MKFFKSANTVWREVAAIGGLSVFLALLYNLFSPHGLSLLRIQPAKEAVSDSVLFSRSVLPDSQGAKQSQPMFDSSKQLDPKISLPSSGHVVASQDPASTVSTEKKETVFKIISLDQLTRLLKEKRGVLLDARAGEDFQKGHIRGARSIPGQEVENHFPELVQIPRDTLVIIYCNNPECHLGRMLADFMSVMEFKHLVLYDEGWDGWTKARMPVDSSSVPE